MTAAGFHNRFLLLAAGLALDAVFGDLPALFRHVPHPVVLAGRAIGVFDRRLNRERRSAAERRRRGILTVAVLVGAPAAIGYLIEWACNTALAGAAAEAFVVAILLAQRSLYDHVLAVAVALQDQGLAAGRQAVAHIVGRDPTRLDGHGVARAAIESLAENFNDGVVAPAFWFLLLGLPGLFAYKCANTLDSMIGHRTERYRDFGWAAARFDDLANLVPARLSGVLLALAAGFLRGAQPKAALLIMLRDAKKHRSPNAGWPEGAMAGALGLALAGPRHYPEGPVADPWVGDGTARAAPRHIFLALRLYQLACLITGGLSIGVWIAAHVRLLA